MTRSKKSKQVAAASKEIKNVPNRLDSEDRALLKEVRVMVDRAQIQSALIDEILVKVEQHFAKKLEQKGGQNGSKH